MLYYYSRISYIFLLIITPTFIKTTTTFNLAFPTNTYAFAAYSGIFYVGAAHAQAENNFALSAAARIGTTLVPLAPQIVMLNNQEGQANPLFAAAISQLVSWGDKPLVTIENVPDTLFFYDSIGFIKNPPELSLISLPGLTDAGNNPATIVHMATDSQRSFLYSPATRNPAKITPVNAFVALRPQSGVVGDPGTGLALITLSQPEPTKKSALSAAPTVAFDGTLDALFIQNPATVTAINDLYWDPILEKLFIALSTTSGALAGDGSRSLVIGSIQDGNLVFNPIAPATAFNSSSNQLVGTTNSSTQTIISQVATMHTSTRLSYLLFIQNNNVYAAPLINGLQDPNKGTLAAVTGTPTNNFASEFPYPFLYRTLTLPATDPSQMITPSTLAAQVGGSVTFPLTSTIQKISISTDAVFITVEDQSDINFSGIFRSQALFGANGMVQAWTNWERAGGIVGNFNDFAYDPFSTFFWSASSTTNSSTITRSGWEDSSLSTPFPEKNGGVQTIFPFTLAGNSFVIVGGNSEFTINQTGSNGTPLTNGQTYTYDLPSVGAITSIVMATDNVQYWFIIGGSKGLVALGGTAGSGWSGNPATLDSLSVYPLGSYSNIRTLKTTETELYILTDLVLDSLIISPARFRQKQLIIYANMQTQKISPIILKLFLIFMFQIRFYYLRQRWACIRRI